MIRFVTMVFVNVRRIRRLSILHERYALGCLMVAAYCVAHAEAPKKIPPPNWFISGEHSAAARKEYVGATDHTIAYEGSGSGLLESISDTAQGGTLMQVSSASAYKGKRIRFSAFLRSNGVAGRAGLWVRADDTDGTTVAFRNCYSASAPKSFVQGTTGWRQVEIFINIPDTAMDLSFGVQIQSTGAVWIDNASMDVIGPYDPAGADQVERTPHPPIDPQKLSPAPQNMDFEQ